MAAGQTVVLPPAVSHHARRVLRLRAQDPLVLFDGEGREFEAVFLPDASDPALASAVISRGGPVDREARVRITLIQALGAQEKIDWLVEKCVELGVDRIVLAPTHRSVVRLDEARRTRRAARLREIVVAACCQCGRNRLPVVDVASELAAALALAPPDAARFLLDPGAAGGLKAPAPGAQPPIWFVVGPEGGFTDEERALAAEFGYRRVRLGRRTLRTESAGLVAIAAALALGAEFE